MNASWEATMLSGIKVVSFTHFLQGPSATQLLADLGADVVKIEPISGAFERSWSATGETLNGLSPFYALANRNIRSMAVNLKDPDAKQVVLDLIAECDVLIESFRPGALDRMGLGYEELSSAFPRLIYASLSGYGSDGPYQDRPGQDVLIQALSGLAAATGSSETPPTPVGASIVDQHAAVLAAFGILAALRGRDQTGHGTRLESNLLNAALDLQIEPMTYALNGMTAQRSSSGVSSPYYRAPYGVFATSDDYLCISLTSLETLAAVLNDEWFLSVDAHDAHARRDDVNQRVKEHLARRSTEEWTNDFSAAGVWFARVNRYSDVLVDPQVLHNESFTSYTHERAGEVRLLAHPLKYGGRRPGIRKPPPELGEDTRAVLEQLGYDAQHIDSLFAQGCVG